MLLFDLVNLISAEVATFIQVRHTPDLVITLSTVERNLKVHRYWSSYCQQCAIKAQCTPGEQRRVTRWEHEDLLEAMQRRLDLAPDSMRIRRQTVEHPFGTLKAWMGSTHFLTKTLKNVSRR